MQKKLGIRVVNQSAANVIIIHYKFEKYFEPLSVIIGELHNSPKKELAKYLVV